MAKVALKIYRYRYRHCGKSLFTYRLLTELKIPLPYISGTTVRCQDATVGFVTVGLMTVGLMAVGLMSFVVRPVDLVTVGVVTVGFVTVGLMTVGLMAVLNFSISHSSHHPY